MSKVVRTEVRKRGAIGQLFKWLFIAFNILMALWMFSYWAQIGKIANDLASDAALTGAGIGAALGTGFILTFWAVGDIVFGLLVLFTRGRTTVIEERLVE